MGTDDVEVGWEAIICSRVPLREDLDRVTDDDTQRRISVVARGSLPVASKLDLIEVSSVDYGWDFTRPFKMSDYCPGVPPAYPDAPETAGPEHREVMSTEPQPVTYTRNGINYRLQVRGYEEPEGD